MSYYIFGFLDAENKPDEAIIGKQNVERIIERINQNTDKEHKYSRNDKYLSWKYPAFNKIEPKTENVYREENRVGVGLFLTLISALAFEVFENSELAIDLFRKNSG